jgi:MHS family proline/betaine transporter-like MFS transporter
MKEAEQQSLTREQKEAVGLLSVGTFLEYFDLMLYVHMAVLLNELFFPKTDPFTASLLAALAFCSSYVLRPFAALIFGYIGDNIGRKATVIITTFLMSFSCIVMANLPTYSQIGITAAWIVTFCRIIQGMSSMGEVVGAELYLTEMIKPPLRYFAVSSMTVAATLGVTVALGVAFFVTSFGINWRIAFWFGAAVALIGSIARTSLRETQEFVDAKKRINKMIKAVNLPPDKNIAYLQKISKRLVISYFLIECTGPLWFCIAYIYCGNLLKTKFGFSPEEVISQNFIVGLIELLSAIFLMLLVVRIHPLKILTVRITIFGILALFIPMILDSLTTSFELLMFQLCIAVIAPTGFPARAIFFSSFPVLNRFTCTSLVFALSRAIMYMVSSFGLFFLTNKYGHTGILILVVPIIIGYIYGIISFKDSNSSGFNLELTKEKVG